MAYSEAEIRELSQRIGKSRATLFRWSRQGCDLRSHSSVQSWIERNKVRETNVAKAKRRRSQDVHSLDCQHPRREQQSSSSGGSRPAGAFDGAGNGELSPAGPKGAQHALARLELEEEQAHRRLQLALQRGDQVEIESTQQFWVRCVESLRKLDLSIELARRDAEQQVPLRQASDVALFISDWFRVSFMVFLSSECRTLMGFQSVGEWKSHAIQAFKSILHLTVRNSLKTQSPIPSWAAEKVKESWNVQ